MALPDGIIAPDFSLPSTNGNNFNLRKDGTGAPLLLFFYPKDFTPTCTGQVCDLRNNYFILKKYGVQIIGISRDGMDSHLAFKKEMELPYPLLSDTDGHVTKLYKAKLPMVGMANRVTYLLDEENRILMHYTNLFSAEGHFNAAHKFIQQNGLDKAWLKENNKTAE